MALMAGEQTFGSLSIKGKNSLGKTNATINFSHEVLRNYDFATLHPHLAAR